LQQATTLDAATAAHFFLLLLLLWVLFTLQAAVKKDVYAVVGALLGRGVTCFASLGFCWGAAMAIQALHDAETFSAAGMLHPSLFGQVGGTQKFCMCQRCAQEGSMQRLSAIGNGNCKELPFWQWLLQAAVFSVLSKRVADVAVPAAAAACQWSIPICASVHFFLLPAYLRSPQCC
jgi:hypothetical protein